MQKEDLFELRFLNGGALSPGWRASVAYCVNKIDAEADKEFCTMLSARYRHGRDASNDQWRSD